jgi:Fe-S cluster assembly protein SufD
MELPSFKGATGWEFTELKGFELGAYPTATAGVLADVEPVFEAPEGGVELRQADHGWERVEAASTEGPLVMPLSQAVEEHGELVDRHLGKLVGAEENAFVARNASEWEGGAFVYVPRNVKLDAPVLLDVLQTQAQTALNWRVLVVLEEGAEAEVWEQYLSTAPGLVTTVVEHVVGENARLRFVSAQELDES